MAPSTAVQASSDLIQSLAKQLSQATENILAIESAAQSEVAAAKALAEQAQKERDAIEIRARKEKEGLLEELEQAREAERVAKAEAKDARMEVEALKKEAENQKRESELVLALSQQRWQDHVALSDKIHSETLSQARKDAQEQQSRLDDLFAERNAQSSQIAELLTLLKGFMATPQRFQTESVEQASESTRVASSSSARQLPPPPAYQLPSPTAQKAARKPQLTARPPHPTPKDTPKEAVRPRDVQSLKPLDSQDSSLRPKPSVADRPYPTPQLKRGKLITAIINIKQEEDDEHIPLNPVEQTGDSEGSVSRAHPKAQGTKQGKSMATEDPNEDYDDDYEDDDEDEMAIGAETNRRELYGSRPVTYMETNTDSDGSDYTPVIRSARKRKATPSVNALGGRSRRVKR